MSWFIQNFDYEDQYSLLSELIKSSEENRERIISFLKKKGFNKKAIFILCQYYYKKWNKGIDIKGEEEDFLTENIELGISYWDDLEWLNQCYTYLFKIYIYHQNWLGAYEISLKDKTGKLLTELPIYLGIDGFLDVVERSCDPVIQVERNFLKEILKIVKN